MRWKERGRCDSQEGYSFLLGGIRQRVQSCLSLSHHRIAVRHLKEPKYSRLKAKEGSNLPMIESAISCWEHSGWAASNGVIA